jgi:hypothetical protein
VRTRRIPTERADPGLVHDYVVDNEPMGRGHCSCRQWDGSRFGWEAVHMKDAPPASFSCEYKPASRFPG